MKGVGVEKKKHKTNLVGLRDTEGGWGLEEEASRLQRTDVRGEGRGDWG